MSIEQLHRNMAFFVKLAYARAESGEMIYVGEAERGLACKCVCPACGRPVIARKGDVKIHHFSHAARSDCAIGPETAIHEFAKQVLAQRLQLTLPPKTAQNKWESVSSGPDQTVTFHHASLEDRSFSGIVPDILLALDQHRLAIEIVVTHRCSPEKIERFRGHRLPALEIDLSELPRDATPEQVTEAVLETAPRDWLFHPWIDKKTAFLQQAEKDLEARCEALALLYKATSERYAAIDEKTIRSEGPVRGSGLKEFLYHTFDGDGCFRVPAWQWQTAVINFFINKQDYKNGFTVSEILSYLQKNDFLHPEFRFLRSNEIDRLEDYFNTAFSDLDFVSPYATVKAYLDALDRKIILRRFRASREQRANSYTLSSLSQELLDQPRPQPRAIPASYDPGF